MQTDPMVRPRKEFTLKNQISVIFCNSWIDVILVVVSAGIAVRYGRSAFGALYRAY